MIKDADQVQSMTQYVTGDPRGLQDNPAIPIGQETTKYRRRLVYEIWRRRP